MTRPTLDGSLTRLEPHKQDREPQPINKSIADALRSFADNIE